MKHVRKIKKILQSKPTLEGAGVHLKRAFGYSEVPLLDPFLMLDHFGSANPRDYMAGFPWHPHRGIETVTYMIEGVVEHGDSIGNKGAINSGEIQWMTAGSGIVHQEMPQRCEGIMKGFQLWVNLPGSHKMMDPRYRGILASEIPEVALGKDIRVKVIAGDVNKVKGPVRDLVVECEYLDVTLGLHAAFDYPVKQGVFVWMSDSAEHSWQNDGESPLRCLCIRARLWLATVERTPSSRNPRAPRFANARTG